MEIVRTNNHTPGDSQDRPAARVPRGSMAPTDILGGSLPACIFRLTFDAAAEGRADAANVVLD